MISGKLFVRSEVVRFPHGTVVLGDCHKLIQEVPDEMFDAVINDPPFGFGAGSHGHVGKSACVGQPLDWDRLWPELWRVTKPTGNM